MQLTDEQVKLVTEIVSQKAIEAYVKFDKEQRKARHDRRLRNIKLLLRNYRSFVRHTEDIKLEIADLEEEIELSFLESEEFAIESIRRSKERTLTMVRYIQKMIKVYEKMSQDEGEEGKRQFRVVHDYFIGDKKMTVKEIAECQNVDPRTVYRDIDKAAETLSVLMFGVDAIRFNG